MAEIHIFRPADESGWPVIERVIKEQCLAAGWSKELTAYVCGELKNVHARLEPYTANIPAECEPAIRHAAAHFKNLANSLFFEIALREARWYTLHNNEPRGGGAV